MQTTRHVRLSRAGHNVDMKWRERSVTPERAVRSIRHGNRVFVGSACATPRTLLRALAPRTRPLAGGSADWRAGVGEAGVVTLPETLDETPPVIKVTTK